LILKYSYQSSNRERKKKGRGKGRRRSKKEEERELLEQEGWGLWCEEQIVINSFIPRERRRNRSVEAHLNVLSLVHESQDPGLSTRDLRFMDSQTKGNVLICSVS
jgi:hypothetical protein